MSDFAIGVRVVCLRDASYWAPPAYWPLMDLRVPERGSEYVIRAMARDFVDAYGRQVDAIGLCFCWLVNPTIPTLSGPQEPTFVLHDYKTGELNFRPVQEKKTDISVFERLLIRAREPEKV